MSVSLGRSLHVVGVGGIVQLAVQRWPRLLVCRRYGAHVLRLVVLDMIDIAEQVDVKGETWWVSVLLTCEGRRRLCNRCAVRCLSLHYSERKDSRVLELPEEMIIDVVVVVVVGMLRC